MRVYDDLKETSPMAFRLLPLRTRLGLRLRRFVRSATRGYVAPSLALPRSIFGGAWEATPMPIRRVVVVCRSATAERLQMEPMELEEVRFQAMEIIGEQRSRLSQLRRDDWQTLLRVVAEREATMLDAALRRAAAHRIIVPESWGAPMAVDALARALDIN
jgi:hypothetical protein